MLPDANGNEVQMMCYWSADGKRPMADPVYFLMILYNVDKVEANKKFSKFKDHCDYIKGRWYIEIAKLKELLENKKISHTPSTFPREEANPFRNRIIARFNAFEEGDMSMVIDARNALLNTMNRQAALTSASVSNATTVAGASSVSGASSSSVEEVMPRPLRQKKVAMMPTFPITSNHQAADKTSRIEPAHLMGLLALNSVPPSPISTASVADSVEFTETNPEVLRGLGIDTDQAAPASDKDKSGDMDILEVADESEMQQSSPGADLPAPSAPPAPSAEPAAINASEQEAPVDMDMPDAEKIEEISTGGKFALFMAQVCFFFFKFKNIFDKLGKMVLDSFFF